ncbi:hypothetical protein ACFQZX_04455 [Mucilaginibacter litoreus]|uniref:Outer membrane protein beta-barrel domain-containing protein n=1 Tax=Mucilaginibacter litoreus TaxID=1048221 RepID=A0ABW3AR94_9SPHI
MDEQFDNKLSNHIREVFENYEHPAANAEHGWAELRKKFPAEEKSSKVAWLWWSSAAAIALVFLSIALWYNDKGAVTTNFAVKPVTKQKPTQDTPKVQQEPVLADQQQPVIARNEAAAASPGGHAALGNKTKYVKGLGVSAFAINLPALKPENIARQRNNPESADAPASQSYAAQQIAPVDSFAFNKTAQQPMLAAADNQPKATLPEGKTEQNKPLSKSAPKSITQMFEDDRRQQNIVADNRKKEDNSGKKVNFSVYAATYFNYAEGSSNQINAGAGFTSDFRLSKNFKLSTGVALAQNTLSYNQQAPQNANVMMAASASIKQESLFTPTITTPVFQNYNANLVGLDIPINIKYEFNPGKSDTYISAGLSSGTFINEAYTYRYVYSDGKSFTGDSQNETERNSFNSFYFGKTLNFSFGVGYPLGGNRLIVEPFLKYPLGGLGAQDIRFGAGGINLKFSFTGKR